MQFFIMRRIRKSLNSLSSKIWKTGPETQAKKGAFTGLQKALWEAKGLSLPEIGRMHDVHKGGAMFAIA